VQRLLFSTLEAFYLDIRFKVLDFVADEVSGALSMLEALSAIWIVCGTCRSEYQKVGQLSQLTIGYLYSLIKPNV
jgi:hypothetical protein